MSEDEMKELADVITSVEEEEEPSMDDPAWQDFVMEQFEPTELTDGKPKVSGLRRLARKLLGPIIVSEPDSYTPPRFVNGIMEQPATVKYRVQILMTKMSHGLTKAYPVTFGGLADVLSNVNCEAEYGRFGSATAETRAEARALKKALGLEKVSWEECTALPVQDNLNREIDDNQVLLINNMCRGCDIDLIKFINCGKRTYKSIGDVSYAAAAKMCEKLNDWRNDKSKIPEDLKGYNKDWRVKQ